MKNKPIKPEQLIDTYKNKWLMIPSTLEHKYVLNIVICFKITTAEIVFYYVEYGLGIQAHFK